MRFGAITFIWTSPFTTAQLDLVERVAELGFDVLELSVEEADLIDPEALREALDRPGLGAVVTGFSTPERDLSSEDSAARAAGVDYAKRCVDVAAAVGASVLAGPLHQPVGTARFIESESRARERERTVEGLRDVCDYAGERGVAVAVEPLNRWESDMLNTVEQGLELCDSVGRENAGLLLDTFHQNIEEKRMGEAIRAAGPRLLHFHASENDRGVPGSGHVPWAEVRDALRDAGYDGVVSLESFSSKIPGLAAAVSMWRPFYDDPDEFARAGLEHLRATFA
jgi:D-psicose/D-tagatose/L-ribulose 3-epimerase